MEEQKKKNREEKQKKKKLKRYLQTVFLGEVILFINCQMQNRNTYLNLNKQSKDTLDSGPQYFR